ncbi:MAG: type IV pilus biogenesis protein PilM [Bacillota bacterium]
MKSLFGKLFGPGALVGVDAGSQAIKVIEVKAVSSRRFTLEGIGSVPTPPNLFDRGQVQDVQGLGQAIREALDQGKIRLRKAALAVPAQVGFVRRISFPRIPLKELRATIALQPERYIPFARDGAVYDVFPLPSDPDNPEISVIVAAAPRQAVEALMEASKLAGLVPARIDLEPLTLYRAAVATGQASRDSSMGIVDLGGSATKISLFEGQIPVISRVVDMPSGGPSDRAAATDDLFWDIRRSLEFALTKLQRPLSRILVTGGLGGDDYLAISLAAYLRGFLANRLPGDFVVEPMRDTGARIPLSHMLAFGLSLPPELFS